MTFNRDSLARDLKIMTLGAVVHFLTKKERCAKGCQSDVLKTDHSVPKEMEK